MSCRGAMDSSHGALPPTSGIRRYHERDTIYASPHPTKGATIQRGLAAAAGHGYGGAGTSEYKTPIGNRPSSTSGTDMNVPSPSGDIPVFNATTLPTGNVIREPFELRPMHEESGPSEQKAQLKDMKEVGANSILSLDTNFPLVLPTSLLFT